MIRIQGPHERAAKPALTVRIPNAAEREAALESDRSQNLRFEVIAQMIADCRGPVWTTSRKIAGEMANTIKQRQTPVEPFRRRGPQLDLNNRMNALTKDLIGIPGVEADNKRLLPPALNGVSWLAVSEQQSA